MNVYKILKLASTGKIPGILKLMGLWAMHITGRRHIGVFLDPVLMCNLRCRMCYFSDEEKRSEMRGLMDDKELEAIENAFFNRAIKVQIGCGAEPTMYSGLERLIRSAKSRGVPSVALVTNGQLIGSGRIRLKSLLEAGLDELTLSMHGTTQDIYEYLMTGARFEYLKKLLDQIAALRKDYPHFSFRVNFTVNIMNMADLLDNGFFRLFPTGAEPDVVQLRPVQNIGASDWKNYDLAKLRDAYSETVGKTVKTCREKGITCIAPTVEQLGKVGSEQGAVSALVEDITYCYVAPGAVYKEDFILGEDTFESYHKRKKTARRLFKGAFGIGLRSRAKRRSKKFNYEVR